MTNTERYLSTLSETAKEIVYLAASTGGHAAMTIVMPALKGGVDSVGGWVKTAAHHALGLPPHVLSALAEAMRRDRRDWLGA